MKYKLIACDIDGTLLNSDAKLSDENAKAITELTKKGIIFVPATGRSFYEAPECVRNHPDIQYFISSNGAVIQNLKSGERIENLIDGETSDEIHRKMRKCNLLLIQHKNNCSLTDSSMCSDDIMDEYNISPNFRKQILECTKPLDNLDEEFSRGEPCEMLSGCFKNVEQLDAFMEEIKDIKNIHCTGASSSIVEIVNSSAGKRNAIQILIEKLGFTTDEIITVGDSKNDLEMISMSPNSVAVSNAIENLKEKAGRIGCSNDEHIIKYILEKIIR